MSADQLIAEFKALPLDQRQQVVEAILGDSSWIPDSFHEGIMDIEKGRTVPMDTALNQKPPSKA